MEALIHISDYRGARFLWQACWENIVQFIKCNYGEMMNRKYYGILVALYITLITFPYIFAWCQVGEGR
ncbi:MAG TPA: hypothetical protein PLV24_11170, partial [Anaerolineaceae bacterium]|nr:hypothetical protein [Anaerolineaceae bacterium]